MKIKKTLLMLMAMLITVCASAQQYDFSKEIETGQTLYFKITDVESNTVAIVPELSEYPYHNTKPSGEISLPTEVEYDEVTYSVTSIGESAFENCSGLTEALTIPNSVTSIGNYAFYNCSGLESLTIPSSVTSIRNYAFYNCSGFTDSLTIPNSVTSIGSGAFEDCSGLTDIVVEAGNTEYADEDGVLYNQDKTTLMLCPAGKTGTYTIPNSVTSIGNLAFSGCSGLESLTIPNSVARIGNFALSGCSGLESLVIGNSVTIIGESAFYYCSGLTSVTIPSSVTNIKWGVFSGCSALTDIVVEPGNTVYAGEDGVLYNQDKTTLIQCPAGKTGTHTIPNSVTNIEWGAFFGCSGLTDILVEPGNTEYANEDGVLYNQDKTTLMLCPIGKTGIYTIPNSVTSIGNSAFRSCSGLESLTIPNSVTSIGYYAFSGCSGLTDILVEPGNTVYADEDGVLFNQDKTTLIQCPAGKTGIYTIPNSVTTIEWGAFEDCSGLTSIICKSSTPPALDYDAFEYVNCDIIVPCGSIEVYQSAEGWDDLTNTFRDKFKAAALSNNETFGAVSVSEYDCSTDPTFTATPKDGYKFVEWSDGSKESTYIVTLDKDTLLTATFEKIEITGIEEVTSKKDFSVYPNPTTNQLYIKSASKDNLDIKIYNSNGVLIQSSRINSDEAIDVSGLATGVYIIRTNNNTAQFIKQ